MGVRKSYTSVLQNTSIGELGFYYLNAPPAWRIHPVRNLLCFQHIGGSPKAKLLLTGFTTYQHCYIQATLHSSMRSIRFLLCYANGMGICVWRCRARERGFVCRSRCSGVWRSV